MRRAAGLTKTTAALADLQARLRHCRRCPRMIPPVITGQAVASPIFLVGQAPGVHEGRVGRPFGWTAGKTLLQWFGRLGVGEEDVRRRIHMAAVSRCFPGKAKGGGDRVPDAEEMAACREWMAAEAALLRPDLVIPVGGLAIRLWLEARRLVDVIGQQRRASFFGREATFIPLPHPSGASTWHQRDPGKQLLEKALDLLREDPTWRACFRS